MNNNLKPIDPLSQKELADLWGNDLSTFQVNRVAQGLRELNQIEAPPLRDPRTYMSPPQNFYLPFFRWATPLVVCASFFIAFVIWHNRPGIESSPSAELELSDQQLVALYEQDLDDSFFDSFIVDREFVMEKLL